MPRGIYDRSHLRKAARYTCERERCEARFHRPPSVRAKGHGRYCSRQCWALDQRSGWINDQGYRWISVGVHPNANELGQIAEHRYVMAMRLGRALYGDETVHHRNGVRDDNAITNLELRVGSHPRGLTIEEAVAWATEMQRRYA